MTGFLYVFFLCVAGVATPIAIVYWERGNRNIAVRWAVGACIAVVLGLFFAAKYYIVPSQPARPYVLWRRFRLVAPLTGGKYPVIEFELENISTTNEVTVELRDITYYYTPDANINVLPYRETGVVSRIPLAPTQKVLGQIPFDNLVVTEEQAKAFNDRKLFLYFFGRANYGGKFNNAYQLPFCAMYDTSIQGNLSVCDERIKFK